MRKLLTGLGILLGLLLIVWLAIGSDWRRLAKSAPKDANVLFWSDAQRSAGFRMMDRVPFLVKSRPVHEGWKVKALGEGAPLPEGLGIDAFMDVQTMSGLVILHEGKIRHEQYGLDFDAKGRWTSFSVAKSFTSTLVGAAIKDGHIKSLNDPVSAYIKGLEGSEYDGVTVEQLLTMTSGVKWIEDYGDPTSDVALFNVQAPEDGHSSLVSYMRKLPRAHPAGDVWNYSTGETNLIGVLVREATGKDLSVYLSEKIWAPYGMEAPGSWLLSPDGEEISGCCIQAATRDFARFGQFILENGEIDGVSILPDNWLLKATTEQVSFGPSGDGYGYQWWTNPDGSFAAQGIFGQGIFIDPKRKLVIASNANWPTAVPAAENQRRDAFYKAVQAAIDGDIR